MSFAAGVVVVADIAVFALLALAGLGMEAAQAASFAVALGLGLAARKVAAARSGAAMPRHGVRIAEVLLVVALAYILRAGVLSLLVRHAGWRADAAMIPAALTAVLVGLASLPYVLRRTRPATGDPHAHLRTAVALTIASLFALRVVYHGQLELLPQEAYYWNYAQHLDIGYLDHPPLVAWLVAAATLPGTNEFLVRLPAIACSAVMLAFATLYARDVGGPAVALRAALLAATLPYFFVIGTMITPDSPLAAAWAAALFFLRRALVDDDERSWLGAGVAIGVGMLSKYSMALVVLAALAFVLVDRPARRALLSPWTWGGAAIALALFSPVIVWNARHDWASFAFQGSRRLASEADHFTLHELLVSILLLLTPWGVAGAVRIVTRVRGAGALAVAPIPATRAADEAARIAGRNGRFILVFTLLPLLAFAVASLRSETKLHWTGPIWIAALPAIAASFASPRAAARRRPIDRFLARSFGPLVHGLMLGYAALLFYYPIHGLAGIRSHHHYLQMGWRDLRAQVQAIEDDVLAETGRRPAIVGLDKHNTTDEMAFYDPRGDGAVDTVSRHLFFADADTLMYARWFPREAFAGRDLILVSRRRPDLDEPPIAAHATRLGPIRAIVARKAGDPVGEYFARVLYGYRPGTSPR